MSFSFSSATLRSSVVYFRSFHNLSFVAIAGIAGIGGTQVAYAASDAAGQSSGVVQLQSILVTASRTEQTTRDVVGDVTVISEAEIRARNAQSVQDILRTIPGIQITSNGGPGKVSNVFIRGANANQTLLLIDGMRVGSATTGTAAFQDIPVDQIERIEVLRGPASSLYGADAIGGVIQIFTKSGRGRPTPMFSVGIGSNETSQLGAGYQGVVGKTSFAFGFQYENTDGINAIANPQNATFNSAHDGYRNKSFSAQMTHSFNDDHKIGFNALMAKTRNHYDSSFPTKNFDYRNDDELGAYSLWSQNRFTDVWTSKLRVGESVDDSKSISPVSSTDLSVSESRFKTLQDQISWQNDFRVLSGLLSVGVENLTQKVSSTTTYDRNKRTIDSLFAGYVANIGSTTLQINARNDDNSQYGSRTTGYGGVSYQFNPVWQAGVSTSSGFRAPTFNELYFPGFGNPDLKPEYSHSNEMFVRYLKDRWNGSLTLFKNSVKDLIVNSGPNFEPANVGKADLEGATLSINRIGQIFSYGASIDWLSPKDASGGANDGKLLPRRSRQAATLYTGAKWNAWDVRVEATGQGERFDDAANTKRLGGYGVVNFVTGYRATPDWTVRLRVDNVFGKRYELARDYNVIRQAALLTVTYQPQR